MTTLDTPTGVGSLLRQWRRRRRMSQLDLASAADVSTRHLSFVETGRSSPSRELVLHLARHLDVPLREQNDLLLAAGFAPAFSQLDLEAPEMSGVHRTIDTILAGSEPNPTLVMNRQWHLVRANESALGWTTGVADHLLEAPIDIIALTLHPDGLAPRIVNLEEVATHLVERVRRQASILGSDTLGAIADRAENWVPRSRRDQPSGDTPTLTMRFETDRGVRSYLSVVSTFGTALDVTAAELTIETFYDVTESSSLDLHRIGDTVLERPDDRSRH